MFINLFGQFNNGTYLSTSTEASGVKEWKYIEWYDPGKDPSEVEGLLRYPAAQSLSEMFQLASRASGETVL